MQAEFTGEISYWPASIPLERINFSPNVPLVGRRQGRRMQQRSKTWSRKQADVG